MAKKSTKSKAKTRKKATSSGAKKSTAKKAASKRKAPQKASTAKKAASKRKAPTAAKKKTTKKTVKKTKTTTSATTKTKKKTSMTKSKGAKGSRAADAAAKSQGAKGNGDATTKPAPRYTSTFAGDRNNSRAAAAKLAESAGLTAIRAASIEARQTTKKYRRISKSPFAPAQLDEFRLMLLEKRAQLVGDVTSMEREALGGDGGSLSHLPQHMADQGSDTFEQSLNLDLAASQRGLLREIDDALERIQNNTYGICELLGKPIKIERLRNTPWARFSIEAARQLEMNPHLAESLSAD